MSWARRSTQNALATMLGRMASSPTTLTLPKGIEQHQPITVIKPGSGLLPARLGETWDQRHLLYFFAWRDIKVRYAQTVLGAAWSIFQPLVLMLVFTLAFSRIGSVKSDGVKYPVWALAGLTYWTFFSRAVTQGADGLLLNSQLVTKTSCPRILIPVTPLVSGLFDFVIALAFYFVFAGWYGYYPDWHIVGLIPTMLLGLAFLFGLVLLLSPLNVRYRDVRQALPFVIQIWLFLSPVAYPITTLGPRWSTVLALNPLVGVIEAFRWSLLGTPGPSPAQLLTSIAITGVTLVVGLMYFARAERTIADLA
jgi:lipopolysaccharide transport system permease protein